MMNSALTTYPKYFQRSRTLFFIAKLDNELSSKVPDIFLEDGSDFDEDNFGDRAKKLSRIVEDVLNGFKKKSVIADSIVVCDESNNFYKGNQDHLFVHILIKPSATVDYYPLWLKVAPLGLMNPPLVAQYIDFIADDEKYFGASE